MSLQVAQVTTEALLKSKSNLLVSQVSTEILLKNKSKLNVAQLAIEVLHKTPISVGTQAQFYKHAIFI